MMYRLDTLVQRIGGRRVGADVAFSSVGKDSRGDCRGQLYVALRGERFDGHEFVAGAAANGAVAAVVDHEMPIDLPQWVVDDTRLALGRLAATWRDDYAGPVVAITGSNGKTTCKEMTAAILAQNGTPLATAGNLNNDIGMPLTLLGVRDEDALVLEMGANHHGEIRYLTTIARPDVALITSIGRAHLEGFGSLEGVSRAKGEIAEGLAPEGTFVYPAYAPWAEYFQGLASGCFAMSFGVDVPALVSTTSPSIRTDWGEEGFRTRFEADFEGELVELALPLAGRHNVSNALAAAALCRALGTPLSMIRDGLATLKPVRRRLQPRRGSSGQRILDDSYNANPDSLAAAVQVLESLPGRRTLVLGDFGELGGDAALQHRQMGAQARAVGVERLLCVGPLSRHTAEGFGEGANHLDNQDALIDALVDATGGDDLILIKGSRASAMDRVADALCGNGDT